MVDVQVEDCGSLFLLDLCSDFARQWVAENVSEESMFFGMKLVVEPRYVRDLLQGMLNDGLDVRMA